MIDQNDLRLRWKALVNRYPVWRILPDLFLDPASYRIFGADITSAMLTNRKSQLAARALEGASPHVLDALSSIADVNISRTSEFLRAVLFLYISLPLGLAAMLSDAAPDAIRGLLEGRTHGILMFLGGAVVFPIAFFSSAWRAKQIGWFLQLYRTGAIRPADEPK